MSDDHRHHTPEACAAMGYTVDKTTYPWVAHKGPRFRPESWFTIPTDKEMRQMLSVIEKQSEIAALRERAEKAERELQRIETERLERQKKHSRCDFARRERLRKLQADLDAAREDVRALVMILNGGAGNWNTLKHSPEWQRIRDRKLLEVRDGE